MLSAFILESGRLERITVNSQEDLPQQAIWIDIVEPTDEENQWIKTVYQQQLPHESEMEAIEATSRFYLDENGTHINSFFLHDFEEHPQNFSVAFILNNNRLFTIHEVELTTFRLFRLRARRQVFTDLNTPQTILLGLFEAKIDHVADIIEEMYATLEEIGKSVLGKAQKDMESTITELAKQEDLIGKVRLSILDQQRILSVLQRQRIFNETLVQDLRDILQDIDSFSPHISFLFEKINFLMDFSLSLVNIQQNKIIKIFSVAAVIFLPPTLVASIYGMNFEFIPELKWIGGYPYVLFLMLLSALTPYWYFKRRGWL